MRTLPAMLLLAAATGLSACSSKDKQAGPPKTVTVCMYSEYIDPALLKDFQARTGLRVRPDYYETSEDMMAKLKVRAGQYDVLIVSDHNIPKLIKLGQLQKLDLAGVPNAGNVAERFRNPPYDPQGLYSLPYQWGTIGLVYRKDKLPNLEPTWGVILDPAKQPGPVVLMESMRDMIGVALICQGHSINSTIPDEIKAAGDLIVKAKGGKVLGFDGGVGGLKKVLAGEAYVAIVYNGDAVREKDENTDFVHPREGTILWVDVMTVPAGPPNAEGAYQFINFILDAKVGAQLSNFNRYATPNQASMPMINKADLDNPCVYPPEEDLKKMQYLTDVGDSTRLYDQVWTRIKAKQ